MKRFCTATVPGLLIVMVGLQVSYAAEPGTAFHSTRAPVPAPDCEARVAYDRDLTLPGYLLPTSAGPQTCIPFTTVAAQPPAGYRGDYYVDEFTDAKLRERWAACKADKPCHDRVYRQVMARHPPNKEYNLKDPHGRFLLGKIEEKGGDTDLGTIRRPAYFSRAPYNEAIAAVDAQTYMVEFTAPVEAYERLHQHMSADIKIRGWYIQGAGVDAGPDAGNAAGKSGGKRRALIIASGGGGDRVTAIDDPVDKAYVIDPATGNTIPDDDWPNATSGVKGEAAWRQVWFTLHEAGFDILALDRRGVGISGGFSDTNTLQQGHDLLRIVSELRSGEGMRALTPAGKLATGRAAAAAVRGDAPARGLPVLFLGSSRGTMSSGWAMTINFDKDCSYDLPTIRCKPAVHDPTVKGTLLIADFSSGVGYLESQTTPKDDGRGPGRDRGLFIGGIEVENNIVFFPSSAILAGIHTWPSAFFARGLWCYADGLEGELDSYSRVRGLKDLVVVRGPHPFETWPAEEKTRVEERMIAYGRAVVFDQKSIPGRRTWSDMKELVATTGDVWEPSTHPTVVSQPAPTPPVLYPGGVKSLRDVTFAAPLGFRPLTLDLYLPPDGGALKPLVVFVHGGAWRSRTARDGGVFRDFPAVLASVAARNYVVASVNYRFSGEARFPAAVQDVETAIRWLRSNSARYGIDPNKVVVWGSSAGGQIAALIGTGCGVAALEGAAAGKGSIPSDCVQGVIDWYGLIDLESVGAELGKPAVPDYVNKYLGCELAQCPAGWARSASPFPYIDAKDPPFLIQHGAADTTVSPKQSQRLYAALQAAGVPAELVIYPGVAHGFAKVPGGGPDEGVNKQAMDKVFEYLGKYFPVPN